MTNKIRGGAFRLTGLILGIVGATVSLTAIVFSTIGLHQAHWNKNIMKSIGNHKKQRQFFRYEHPDLVREGVVIENE